MRIHHLPKGITERLGGGRPVFLKKVQTLYCDRMSRERICPGQCAKCYSRLEQMVDDMPTEVIGSDAVIGFWHNCVREVALGVVERYHEQKERRPITRDRADPTRVSTADFVKNLGGSE